MAKLKIRISDEKSEKEYTLDEIEQMAAIAGTQKRLAILLDVDEDTIVNTKKINKGFSDAIEAGKEKANAAVIRTLYKKAYKDGDIGAIKYWLGNRLPDEWADKTKTEIKAEVNTLTSILDELDGPKA